MWLRAPICAGLVIFVKIEVDQSITMTTKKYSKEEITAIYHTPLLELIYHAATVHREYQDTSEVQVCTLLSVKTGGCSEDCAYCPQVARTIRMYK